MKARARALLIWVLPPAAAFAIVGAAWGYVACKADGGPVVTLRENGEEVGERRAAAVSAWLERRTAERVPVPDGSLLGLRLEAVEIGADPDSGTVATVNFGYASPSARAGSELGTLSLTLAMYGVPESNFGRLDRTAARYAELSPEIGVWWLSPVPEGSTHLFVAVPSENGWHLLLQFHGLPRPDAAQLASFLRPFVPLLLEHRGAAPAVPPWERTPTDAPLGR